MKYEFSYKGYHFIFSVRKSLPTSSDFSAYLEPSGNCLSWGKTEKIAARKCKEDLQSTVDLLEEDLKKSKKKRILDDHNRKYVEEYIFSRNPT